MGYKISQQIFVSCSRFFWFAWGAPLMPTPSFGKQCGARETTAGSQNKNGFLSTIRRTKLNAINRIKVKVANPTTKIRRKCASQNSFLISNFRASSFIRSKASDESRCSSKRSSEFCQIFARQKQPTTKRKGATEVANVLVHISQNSVAILEIAPSLYIMHSTVRRFFTLVNRQAHEARKIA